jgi:cation transport ATPase
MVLGEKKERKRNEKERKEKKGKKNTEQKKRSKIKKEKEKKGKNRKKKNTIKKKRKKERKASTKERRESFMGGVYIFCLVWLSVATFVSASWRSETPGPNPSCFFSQCKSKLADLPIHSSHISHTYIYITYIYNNI